jgi:hypothetical protein
MAEQLLFPFAALKSRRTWTAPSPVFMRFRPRSKPLRWRTMGLYLEEVSKLNQCRNHRVEMQSTTEHLVGRRKFVLLCLLSTRLAPRPYIVSRVFLGA